MVHSIELLEGPPALAHTTGLAAAAAEVARAAAAAAAGSAAGTSLGRASAQHAAAIESQPALPYYQLPPAVQQQIVLVDSEEGLAHMEQALFPSSSSDGSSCSSRSGSSDGGSSSDTDGEGDGTTTISSSSSGGSAPRGFGSPVSPFRLVVGIDCEWQPYSTRRGDPKTPVSLLQVRSDWLGIMVCATMQERRLLGPAAHVLRGCAGHAVLSGWLALAQVLAGGVWFRYHLKSICPVLAAGHA